MRWIFGMLDLPLLGIDARAYPQLPLPRQRDSVTRWLNGAWSDRLSLVLDA
jgi:hypothetical protein